MAMPKLILLSAFAIAFWAGAATAQVSCPAPHEDYRKPIPSWAGFGYQINACPGDKIDVAASLIVSTAAPYGILQIPQTLPWYVNLKMLSGDQIEYLRDRCESDLPCVAHFRVTVLSIQHPPVRTLPGEWREGDLICSADYGQPRCAGHSAGRVIATLDGWR